MSRTGAWFPTAALSACFATALLLTARLEAQGPKGGLPPATVVTARVVEREEAVGQTFIGTLQPRRRSTVGSAVDGRVEQYPVNDGQWVKKGDVLAELLKEATKIELENAKAALRVRQAELDEFLNKALPEDIDQAKAKLAATEAQLRYARARNTRTEALFQRGTGITQEDMDLSYSNLMTAEQNQIGAAAALKLLENWPRPEKLAQAEAQRDAQQEAVNQIADRLAKYTIRAPFDGYVVQKHTEVGAWISRGDQIAEVIAIDPIEVAVSVPETAIASLQEAMTAAEEAGGMLQSVVQVDALGTELFNGSVERIVPQADVRSRTFPVKVLLENPPAGKSHKFKAGMICHVGLAVGRAQTVKLVPKDAVVLDQGKAHVMAADKVVDPMTKAESILARRVDVEIGAAFGSLIQVTGSLKPGAAVVTRGNERLFPGQPLNVVKEEK
jgi:RND family efflux transporter MFP subunit